MKRKKSYKNGTEFSLIKEFCNVSVYPFKNKKAKNSLHSLKINKYYAIIIKEVLTMIQNIIFDVGGVLARPQSGNWFITPNFWQIIDKQLVEEENH